MEPIVRVGNVAVGIGGVGIVVVGGGLTDAGCLAFARSDARFLRLGYRSLLAVALPSWIPMRVGAEWIASTEGWTAKGVPTPTWLGPDSLSRMPEG